MSIATEISRLQSDSLAIASAIAAKGVTVPSGSGFDDYATLIASIPSGGGASYIPVEYIETDGTAYINTGIKGNAPMSVECLVRAVSVSANKYLMGCRKDSGSTRFSPLVILSGNKASFAYYSGLSGGTDISISISNQKTFRFKSVLRNGTSSISTIQAGETSYTSASMSSNNTVTCGMDMYLFSYNNQGTAQTPQSGVRFYEVKIYSDASFGALAWNGVPCYYNGEYGMWDTVSKSFFGNVAGSGAFTGPSIS